MVQDFDVFGSKSLFPFWTLLKVSKQGISSSICFALTIIDSKVVTREFLSPADLFRAQTLRVYELAEFVMVDEYKHVMLRPF